MEPHAPPPDETPEADLAPAADPDLSAEDPSVILERLDSPMDHPAATAYDRVQSRDDTPEASSSSVPLSWLAGAAFVVLGVVAVWFWVSQEDTAATDLLRHAVEVATEFRPIEITDDPDRASAFVLEQFQVVTSPPELEGFVLLGVGPAELASGVVVPAYRYDGAQGVTVVIFSYDYPLLDEAAADGLLTLAPEVYARLAEPEPVDSRRQGDAYTVTWRRRSTLYTAVVPGPDVAERILQSVRRPEI